MARTNIEWLNLNANRNYPIKEDASRLDLTGSYELPVDFIVDAVFVININNSRRFFIKKLSIYSDVVNAQIYDETDKLCFTFTVIKTGFTTNQLVPIQGFNDDATAEGKIVIGSLDTILDGPQGIFEFDIFGTEFEPTTVIPNIRGVFTLSKYDALATFPLLQNHVKLEEGNNIQLTVIPETNTIRIDAIEGAGLGAVCDCEEDDPVASAQPVAFINGIGGDSDFNFNLRGIGCISITPIENGLKIENTCVENCCGCSDLETLQALADSLDARVDALENP